MLNVNQIFLLSFFISVKTLFNILEDRSILKIVDFWCLSVV